MEERRMTDLILEGLSGHAAELTALGIEVDRQFLAELGLTLFKEAKKKGLDKTMASSLKRAATTSVAVNLGL